MIARLRSWWQKTSKSRLVLIITLLVILFVLLIGGYFFNWTWTGFGPYTPPTSGFQREKTLYDWFQLAIIPVVLAFGVWWLTHLQQQRDQQLSDQRAKIEREAAEKQAQAEREAAEERAKAEREIATDNQREAALQAYIDKVSELLLHERLCESPPPQDVVIIAQARTATVLRILDPIRCASIIQFLSRVGILRLCVENSAKSSFDWPLKNEYSLAGIELPETNFNSVDLSMIHLEGANFYRAFLREANLEGTDLSRANLQRANLMHANLQKANLNEANLQGARLFGADLRDASLVFADLTKANLKEAKYTDEQLNDAKSLEGATLRDGTKHD
jgi:hypothetical protein